MQLIIAESFIQLINASFMFILLIYMQKSGYSDHEGASFTKFRFLGVLLLAVPLGFFIRGKKIKPLFWLSCFLVPVSSLLIIYCIEHHYDTLLGLAQFVWGIGLVCMQITALPYILRNASPDTITEGISLSHATWSIAGITAGVLIFTLRMINPALFDEKMILIILSLAGFGAFYFIGRIKIEEEVSEAGNGKENKKYDWNLIFQALVPTTLIAVGAGLTVPFLGLFFFNVYGLDSHEYSIMASSSLILVLFGMLLVPTIKNRVGYRRAVPITQLFSVSALILLAVTEFFSEYSWAVALAILFNIIRQPLMNIAAPMTSEITMLYVGKRNQEMMSAITAAIWSGSWFISAWLFEVLRRQGLSYMSIFLITAGLYLLGIVMYQILIRTYERRREEELHSQEIIG